MRKLGGYGVAHQHIDRAAKRAGNHDASSRERLTKIGELVGELCDRLGRMTKHGRSDAGFDGFTVLFQDHLD